MTFFDKYVAALNKGDIEEIVALFDENVYFSDWGARVIGGRKPLVANNKDELRGIYTKAFAGGPPVVTLVKQSQFSMEYDVTLGKFTMPCIGCAGFGADGLVTEYIIRPR